MHFTTVGNEHDLALSELGQSTLRQLTRAWFAFERRLALVPIVRRLDLGSFSSPIIRTAAAFASAGG